MTISKRPWFSGLQSKLQFPILTMLIILITGVVFFLSRIIESEYKTDMERRLSAAISSVKNSEKIRNQNLILRFREVPNQPSFKAIAQLGDPLTFTKSLQSLIRGLNVDAALFTSAKGETVAFSAPETTLDRGYFETASVPSIYKSFKENSPTTDLVQIGNKLFNLISVPTLINDRPIGVITFGLELGDEVAKDLKELSHADVFFIAKNKIIATTSKKLSSLNEISQVDTIREILVEGEHYFISAGRFSDFLLDGDFKFALSCSSEIEWKKKSSTHLMFFGCALLILLVCGFLVSGFIRSTLNNLQKLSRAVEQFGSDKIFTSVIIQSNDEISDLALVFNQMQQRLNTAESEMVLLNSNLVSAKENAEAGNKAKSQFLAIMTHELRTPLNGILGIASLLNKPDLTKEQQEFIKIIESSGRSLLNTIGSILEYSKLESSRLPLKSSRVTLIDIARNVIKHYQEEASDKGIALTFRDAEVAPQIFLGAPDSLRQTLSNLVSNAIKFTFKGSVEVTLEISPVTDQRISITFKVCDTGIGMSQEVQGKLFEPFFQADGTSSRSFGGTGLGLAICSRLVEKMGGVIGVRSAIDQGSEFYFTVPMELYVSA